VFKLIARLFRLAEFSKPDPDKECTGDMVTLNTGFAALTVLIVSCLTSR